jgi:hypothetical protein
MPSLEQICASIEGRLAELNTELIALEDARAALIRQRSASGPTGASANGATAPRRRQPPASAREQRVRRKPLPSPGSRASTPAKRAKAPKASDLLVADKLEAMLQGESGGLSAVTIAERSNASYRQVLDLLRELERTGRVRRTGTRRTTLWRLITDEERIAERAAELERRSAKSAS